MQVGAAILLKLSLRKLLLLVAVLLPSVALLNTTPARAASPIRSQTESAATPIPTQPTYDVASIKPHKPGDSSWGINSNDQSYTATNVSLETLLSDAYGIRRDLISGIPKWANDARFDLQAKVVDPDLEALKKLSRAQQRAMLAALLTDRFHVKVHTETKTLPVYDLVIMKDGPRFKESVLQNAAPGSGNTPSPGSTYVRKSGQLTEMTSTAVAISSLTDQLAGELNRTVIDKTNLSGKYDLSLKWMPDQLSASGAYNDSAAAAEAGTSIFTALQEQLGLKLIAAKGPVVTLVVDQADPPTPN